jgi:hypothetical protein
VSAAGLVYVVTYGVWPERCVLDGVYSSLDIVADRIKAIEPDYGKPTVTAVWIDVQVPDQQVVP